VRVIEIASNRETGDVIPHAGAIEGGDPSWLPNNKAFVYGRLQELPPEAPPAEVRQKFRSYVHVLGTDSTNDRPVFGYGVVPSINVDASLHGFKRRRDPSMPWVFLMEASHPTALITSPQLKRLASRTHNGEKWRISLTV